MLRRKIGAAMSIALLRRSAAFLAGIAILVFQQTGPVRADTATADQLKFFKSYPVTGDFVIGGVALRGQGVTDPANPTQKLATGTIPITGVPQDADIVAAFLYWQSMETPLTASQLIADHGLFRGHKIVGKSVGPDGVLSCWGSGGGGGNGNSATVLRTYRASVMQFLPFKTEDGTPTGIPTGKRLVNDADLTANGFALNVVKLPDVGGGGSQSPQSGNQANLLEGASLVVVYRRPADPLRMVVLYDGAYSADQGHGGVFSQTIKGLDDALDSSAGAKVALMVGDGDQNFQETLTIRGGGTTPVQTYTNPFVGALGFSWENLQKDISNDDVFTASSSTFRDQLNVSVAPNGPSIDCLSFAGAVASAKVKDTDFDGLLDRWEDYGLQDPVDPLVPTLDLPGMGADKNVQDIFVQVDYMKLSAANAYTAPSGDVVGGHTHKLSEAVINNIASVFESAAPRRNPADSSQTETGPIKIHIDIGSNYPTNPNTVHGTNAKGGQEIEETAACAAGTTTCQFPGFKGVVGWKVGFSAIRDQPLNYSGEVACAQAGAACNRRFDEIRHKAFRYALLAHAIGVPQVDDPTTTTKDESKYPRSIAGVGDAGNGGGDFMNTLGFWEGNVGTPYIQAAVFVHELGHTLGLRHGGPGGSATNPAPNCKPNYESVMNYLYLVRGLTLPDGSPKVDYSKQVLGDMDEGALTELTPLQGVSPYAVDMFYPNRWFALKSQSWLDTHIGTSTATKHCDGTPLNTGEENKWVRIDGAYPTTAPNDWDGNGTYVSSVIQDVNFNGLTDDTKSDGTVVSPKKDGTFTGYDDFLNMDLRQGASRRRSWGLSLELETTENAAADPGWADPGWADPGWADPGWADPGWADPGWADPGWADPGWADPGWASDLDKKIAESLGNAPNTLSATANVALKSIDLKWYPPTVGTATKWQIWRAVGQITKNNKPTKIVDLQVNSPLFTYGSDSSVLYHDTSAKNNINYSYFVTAVFGSGSNAQTSGGSNIVYPARR